MGPTHVRPGTVLGAREGFLAGPFRGRHGILERARLVQSPGDEEVVDARCRPREDVAEARDAAYGARVQRR